MAGSGPGSCGSGTGDCGAADCSPPGGGGCDPGEGGGGRSGCGTRTGSCGAGGSERWDGGLVPLSGTLESLEAFHVRPSPSLKETGPLFANTSVDEEKARSPLKRTDGFLTRTKSPTAIFGSLAALLRSVYSLLLCC
ncbi:unnamed protein product [Ixodes pacificus]